MSTVFTSHSRVRVRLRGERACSQRNGQDGNCLLPGTATFTLPPNMACELHAFISQDKKHDDGFVQLCMRMLLESMAATGMLPKRVALWSDGGPAHFKLLAQLQFALIQLALEFSIRFLWAFFQSLHGRGMQDGGGNWLKAAVAMAIVAGCSIDDAYAFWMLCLERLTENKSEHNFTSRRHFWFVTVTEAMEYRAKMPVSVTGLALTLALTPTLTITLTITLVGSINIKGTKAVTAGWFFFAT